MKLNSLIDEMKLVFGDQFAEPKTEPLDEAQKAKKMGKKAMKMARIKAKNDKAASKFNKSQKARIATNMSNFYKHAEKEGQKSAAKPRPTPLSKDKPRSNARSIGSVDQPMYQKNTGGSKHSSVGGGGKRHTPFKRNSELGKGPGTPPGFRRVWGPRDHHEKKCWNCHCGNIYSDGCVCIGTGATKDCPQGHRKKVHIKKRYRHAYNKLYKAGYSQAVHRWVGKNKK